MTLTPVDYRHRMAIIFFFSAGSDAQDSKSQTLCIAGRSFRLPQQPCPVWAKKMSRLSNLDVKKNGSARKSRVAIYKYINSIGRAASQNSETGM